MDKLFEIVHEDNALLVINKPAGLVCHPTKGDEYSSLISRIHLHLGKDSPAHMINRLDRETSGLVVVAKDDTTARGLRRIWEKRRVRKEYLAIVHGVVAAEDGRIDARLGKDENSRVTIKGCVRPDGAEARTEFQVERRFRRAEGDFTLLRVELFTGRKHQIRIHLSHIGHPIVGDKMYGGDEEAYLAFVQYRLTGEQSRKLILPNHALHARFLKLDWVLQPSEFHVEPERWFAEFASGGEDLGASLQKPLSDGAKSA